MTIVLHSRSMSTPSAVEDDHERVVVRQDRETGLRLIVAVHSTVLGPALGGLRLRAYPGGLREALDDVLALARTMTLKAAAAGLDLGGGKAVILDDGDAAAREARLEAAGAAIEELGGDYITAEDIGTTTADMEVIARRTRYVVGRSAAAGGGGDPSPATAVTVLEAIRHGLAAAVASPALDGRRVGVIGLGKVGSVLADLLLDAGAEVVACDIDPARTMPLEGRAGVRVAASAEAVLAEPLDVLAPCAAGGLIDAGTARALDCRVVAGAANNPLTDREVARILAARGVVCVPDFLANCGGLIHVACEWYGEHAADPDECVARAMERLEEAIERAAAEGSTPIEVAERQALERVEQARAAA